MYRRGFQTGIQCRFQLIFTFYKTTSGTTQCEGRTDNQWNTNLLCKLFTFQHGVGYACRCYGNTHLQHPLAEQVAVFCLIDCFNVYPDQAYIILLPDTQLIYFFTQVQRSLSTHCRQYSIDIIFLQYLFYTFRSQRQQVHLIRNYGIGHDRSRVAVDQCYFDSFFS
ncbi:hypothetical protein D9M68_808100 [compost metagenome]